MTPQEQQQLSQFLNQLTQAKLSQKDPEAETLIQAAIKQQPDANYLLIQRALILEQALNNAKTQIADLQNQVRNQPSNTSNSFLNNDPWAQPVSNAAPVPGAGNYQMPRYAPPPTQPSAFGGGASSFLGNVATTAAGVVAGSFLFQGIENLMGGHHGSSGWGQHDQGFSEHVSEQTVINNYYGDDAMQMADNQQEQNDYLVSDDSDFQDDNGDSDWI
ncbi:MAG: DUF2076 domain-containing protein [Methylomonas sp.]